MCGTLYVVVNQTRGSAWIEPYPIIDFHPIIDSTLNSEEKKTYTEHLASARREVKRCSEDTFHGRLRFRWIWSNVGQSLENDSLGQGWKSELDDVVKNSEFFKSLVSGVSVEIMEVEEWHEHRQCFRADTSVNSLVSTMIP